MRVEQRLVVIQHPHVEPVTQCVEPAVVLAEFTSRGKQLAPQFLLLRFTGQLVDRHQHAPQRPIGNDRIVLVEQVGRISAGHAEKKLQVEIVTRHGDRADEVLVLAGVEAGHDVFDHGPISPAPEMPEHHLATIGRNHLRRIAIFPSHDNGQRDAQHEQRGDLQASDVHRAAP